MIQCFVALAVSITTIGHGGVTGFGALLVTQVRFSQDEDLTTEFVSWSAATPGTASVMACIISSMIMDLLGRRLAHMIVTALIFSGWIIIALANNELILIIGRIIQGISFGLMIPLRSVLIGEYTSPKNRGAFLATVSLSQGCGILVIHLLGSFLYWRTACFICSTFHILSLIITFFSPESPSWLAKKERFDQCKASFRWLRGDNEDDELEKLVKARSELNNFEKITNIYGILRVLRKKEFYKPVILMIHMFWMSEFCGASIIACYASIILSTVVGPTVHVNFWMVFIDVNRLVTNTFAVYLARICKRKFLVYSSAILCIICHLVVAGYVYLRRHDLFIYDAMWLPLVLINILYFSIVFMIAMPYIIAGEVFPLQYKGIAGSITTACLSSSHFLCVKIFPGMVDSLGFEVTYITFATAITYCLIVTKALLLETKGKTLLEIEEEFRGIPKNEGVMDGVTTALGASEDTEPCLSRTNID